MFFKHSYKRTTLRLAQRNKFVLTFVALCVLGAFLHIAPVLLWTEQVFVSLMGGFLSLRDQVSYLVNPSFLFPERGHLERLQQENLSLYNHLAGMRATYEENKYLRKQLHFTRLHAKKFVTANVLSAPRYGRCFLINAGHEDGLKKGQPVLAFEAVVGRIDCVTAKTARVMPITHAKSRIPIMHATEKHHAILTGQGDAVPILIHEKNEKEGWCKGMWVTSTHGGVFTRGIPVGLLGAEEASDEQKDFVSKRFVPLAAINNIETVQVILQKRDDNKPDGNL